MGKPRQTPPLPKNGLDDDLLDWDSDEDPALIEAEDALWDLFDKENVQLDARGRRILWPNGIGLSIDQSVERIQKLYPDFPTQLIVDFLIDWIEQIIPENYSEKELGDLNRLTQEWIDQYERHAKPPATPSRTRHS